MFDARLEAAEQRQIAAAQSPLEALDLAGEPAFLKPPDLPRPALAWGSW